MPIDFAAIGRKILMLVLVALVFGISTALSMLAGTNWTAELGTGTAATLVAVLLQYSVPESKRRFDNYARHRGWLKPE